jgi:ribonuclease HI
LVDNVKFLGFILDSKLSWLPHFETRFKKACMVFGQCRRVFGKTWGLTPKSLRWLYTMVVRPIITYGSLVWWKRAQKVTVISKLCHLQRLACLGITGAFCTTPTAAMEMLLGLTPLHIFIKMTACADLQRLKASKQLCNGFAFVGHSKLWSYLVSTNSLWNAPKDYGASVEFTNHNYKVILPDRGDWETLPYPTCGDIVMYTDGSLRNGLAGAGIYSNDYEINAAIQLGSLVSIFQAELFAILHCASVCLAAEFRDRHIDICSDSRAALMALESYHFNSKLALECRALLHKLCQHNVVCLIWVPGHANIAGNEKADELARSGSSTELLGPEPALPLSVGWAKSTIKTLGHNEHSFYWNSLPGCRQAKLYLTVPLSEECLKDFSKNKLRLLVGAITGHFPCNKHLTTMGLAQSSLCDRCESDEGSMYHLVCICPTFAQKRFNILGGHVLSQNEYENLSPKKLTDFLVATLGLYPNNAQNI